MDKAKIEKLKTMVCDRMERLDRGDIENPGTAEFAKNLASAYLKLCEICEMEDEYSQRGYSRYDGGMSRAYGGDSYYSGRRDSMGRYSRNGGDPREQLRSMMDEPGLTSSQREAIRKAMDMM